MLIAISVRVAIETKVYERTIFSHVKILWCDEKMIYQHLNVKPLLLN